MARYPSLKRRRARCKPGTAAPLSNRHPNHQTPTLERCASGLPPPFLQALFHGIGHGRDHAARGQRKPPPIILFGHHRTPATNCTSSAAHTATRLPLFAPPNPQTRCASWIEPRRLLPPLSTFAPNIGKLHQAQRPPPPPIDPSRDLPHLPRDHRTMAEPAAPGELGLSIIGLGTQYPPHNITSKGLETISKKFYPDSPA